MKPNARVKGEITTLTEVSLEFVNIQDFAQHALVQIVCKFNKIMKKMWRRNSRELFLTFQQTLQTRHYLQLVTRH